MRLAITGGLMEPHGVWEAGLEEIVVTRSRLLEDVSERALLALLEFGERANMPLCEDKRLEGPDSPPRDDDQEVLVLADDANLLIRFDLKVVAQHAAVLLG